VKCYLSTVFKKIGVTNRTELAVWKLTGEVNYVPQPLTPRLAS
jgi:DNA-binding NarL/FixJ family response regulator